MPPFGLGGHHLEPAAVRAGLLSDDEAARLAAVKDIRRLPDEEASDASFACLRDPSQRVRFQALTHILRGGTSTDDKTRLAKLAGSAGDVDAEARQNLLDDLVDMDDELWKRARFTVAMGANVTKSTGIIRELIEIVQARSGLPKLGRQYEVAKDKVEFTDITWPDLCCRCGSANPEGITKVDASYDTRGQIGFGPGGLQAVKARVVLHLPTCGSCTGSKKDVRGFIFFIPIVKLLQVHVSVPSIDFVIASRSGPHGWIVV